MCGILILLQSINSPKIDLTELINSNQKRGPDTYGSQSIKLSYHELEMHATTLNLRDTPAPQPIIDSTLNILTFNGEIYDGIDVPAHENDTSSLSEILQTKITEHDILETLSKIEGEWALCYYQKYLNCVYFGRDFLGKRSLIYHLPENDNDALIITSVTTKQFVKASLPLIDESTIDSVESKNDMYWKEVPTSGLFKINLENKRIEIEELKWNTHKGLTTPNIIVNTTLPTSMDLQTIVDLQKLPPVLNEVTRKALEEFKTVLQNAVKKRISTIPTPINDCRLAILFSGGLDCMVLAALAHNHIPKNEPIDLLNVAFENPREVLYKLKNNEKFDIFDVPDRKTGRLGYEELQKKFPTRNWRFVEVDVLYEETVRWREHVLGLMYPLETVMDLSIAIALWFASRGLGKINTKDGYEEYNSRTRVLLSGLGADEQLGGYSRHRKAFEKNGWEMLQKELQVDVGRISTRNLGRDDRIISDHGKELRFPYLDESVMTFLSSLPVYIKTDPRYERAVGDKILLRLMAAELGLERASIEAKRAMQFGTRSAKMENTKKGHYNC
jgi:asparagine synthetase B (glutamine-hydrolysing)